MEKEKGIQRKNMIAAIISAIHKGAEKSINADQELKIEINPRTGALKAWTLIKIVDSVSDPINEIHIEKARTLFGSYKVGQIIERQVKSDFLVQLGRIAAQTARQAIAQMVRQFEKERIFDDYKNLVGDIVSGIVRRKEHGNLIVDLGKTTAILPLRERVTNEDYMPGERIRCLLLEIEATPRRPELILSRSHIKFVRKLFELEITEIADGTVLIQRIARESGYRTKISVNSIDLKVDPVGACVGARGARVKSIIRELGGEKIDIIRHYDDPKKMLEEAIRPATPKNIKIDITNRTIYFEVAESDLSIAIGKRGQNAKLTSKLIGWRLDIAKEKKHNIGFDERIERAASGLGHIPGIDDTLAHRLVGIGITTPEAFEGVIEQDLIDANFTPKEAMLILKKVKEFNASQVH